MFTILVPSTELDRSCDEGRECEAHAFPSSFEMSPSCLKKLVTVQSMSVIRMMDKNSNRPQIARQVTPLGINEPFLPPNLAPLPAHLSPNDKDLVSVRL